MAEEGEACAAVHLSFDHLRFGMFTSSVRPLWNEWGEGGAHGGVVERESTGERVEVGQVLGPGLLDPGGEAFIVASVWGEQGGEVADEGSEPCHLGAGAGPASIRCR